MLVKFNGPPKKPFELPENSIELLGTSTGQEKSTGLPMKFTGKPGKSSGIAVKFTGIPEKSTGIPGK